MEIIVPTEKEYKRNQRDKMIHRTVKISLVLMAIGLGYLFVEFYEVIKVTLQGSLLDF
ncbi:hypothetical protein QLX67_04665 [Balneolaceae bacterium ANBcel3]|nr:hypothetical protein [Balneolaceae bacterium ANBcel3]